VLPDYGVRVDFDAVNLNTALHLYFLALMTCGFYAGLHFYWKRWVPAGAMDLEWVWI